MSVCFKLAVLLIAAWVLPISAWAQITREQALAAVYPGAVILAERIFLTAAEKAEARDLSGVEMETSLIARYIASRDGRTVGRAYVDTHTVRTKKESLIICLDEEGEVKRIEVTAFLEPPEYQAPRPWYDQYNDRKLTDDLRLNRAIRPIAGASLTAKATNDAARRVLAIDQVLRKAAK